jgi:hypothetical protein
LHVASIVTQDDTVRVGNGHDPEVENLPQLKHSRMRSQQEVDETMYYEAGKRLSGMLTSYYEDYRLILLLMMMRGIFVSMARRPPTFNLDQRHVQVAVAPSYGADLKHFVLSKVFQLI